MGRLAASQQLSDPASQQALAFRDTNGMRPDFIRTSASGRDEFTDPSLAGSVVRNPDGSLSCSPELLQAIQPYLGSGEFLGLQSRPFDFLTQREWEIYGTEVQHIEQRDCHTFLLGGRWHEGTIETRTRLQFKGPALIGGFESPAADQDAETDCRRTGLYAYDYWQVLPSLTLVCGIAWNRIDHPENFRNPPVSTNQVVDEQFSGKLGFTWRTSEWFTLRETCPA